MNLKQFVTVHAELGPAESIGATPIGFRRVVPILGGRVKGAFEARVLPGGADWQSVLANGTVELEAHYQLELTTGGRIEVVSRGVRAASAVVLERIERGEEVDPGEYYFRTAMRMHTAVPALLWLNERLFIGRAKRTKFAAILDVFEVP